MPDCYFIEFLTTTKYTAVIVECKCDIRLGSKTLKEPRKLKEDIEAKFQNFSRQGRRMVVIPSGAGKGVENLLKTMWEVAYCGEEICRVCSWCS